MKISRKLTLAFLLISLGSLAAISILSYLIAEQILTKRVKYQLESLAAIQQNKLESIVAQNIERLSLVSSRTQLRLSLESFIKEPKKEYREKMNRILRDARASIASFEDISVLNLEGEIVASTDLESIGKTRSDEEFFIRGQKRNSADMFFLDVGGRLKVYLSGPLYLENRLLGVVAIKSDTNDIISLVKDYSGLGETGESLIARESGSGDAVFLTPLRFDENAALRRTVSKDNLGDPVTQALLKNKDFLVDAMDYRGKGVLAVTHYIEKTDWGFVVKIDKAEVLSPVIKLRNLLMLLIFLSSIVVVAISFYLARTITKPIISLTRAASKLGEGNLSIRVKPTATDEVGTLAQAFNDMTCRLEESHSALTGEVTERKRAEERLIHLNAVLRAIRNVNHLITKELNRDKLLKDICNSLTETRDYSCTWIVVLDELGKVIASAEAGLAAKFPRFLKRLESDELIPCVKDVLTGPDVIAIRQNASTDCVGCPLSKKHLDSGVMTVRMEYGGKVRGVLGAYVPVAFLEDKEEQSLLIEVAGDIALALDRIAQKEDLQKSEEKYRLHFENVSDVIFSYDHKFTILNVSPSVEKVIGYKPEEFVGKTFLQLNLLAPESLKKAVTNAKRVLSGEEISPTEYEFITKDGARLFAEVTSAPFFKEGKVIAALSVARDATERRKAEEIQRKLEAEKLVVEEMKKLDRMKSEFVSIITHELRTPMTPLKSSVEMFLDGSLGEVTPEQKEFLDMMAKNIERLSQFTTEVLSLSRLEANRYSFDLTMVSIRAALEPVVELLRSKAASKNSTLSLEVGAELSVFADADALAQVGTNLLNNAIVHTPEGTAIRVSSEKLNEDFIEISVADNGQGIPEDALPNIFDRFYQADRKKGPGYKGTGIGLSLCKGLVEAMGGEISVETKLGEGTTFKFTLPTREPLQGSAEQ